MWIARFAVPVALVLALLFACLAPDAARATATRVSAKEVLIQAQRAGGRNYTYSQGTAAELEGVQLARPPEDASCEALEAALTASGFVLAPVGPSDRQVYLVERVRR